MAVVAVAARDSCRAARYSAMRRDIAHNYKTVRADFDIVTHVNRTEKDCASSYQNVVTDRRMALTRVLARSSESNVVKHDAVATDHCSFANYHAGAVVAEITFAYRCARMNLEARKETGYLGEQPRNERYPQLPEQMDETMGGNRLEARI